MGNRGSARQGLINNEITQATSSATNLRDLEVAGERVKYRHDVCKYLTIIRTIIGLLTVVGKLHIYGDRNCPKHYQKTWLSFHLMVVAS